MRQRKPRSDLATFTGHLKITNLLVTALIVQSAPAFAAQYIVQERTTKKCKIVDRVPGVGNWVIVGHAPAATDSSMWNLKWCVAVISESQRSRKPRRRPYVAPL
jgi:hypothetical protein